MDSFHNSTRSLGLAYSPLVTVVYAFIYLPVFLAIVIGNMMVILAFFKNKKLRKVSNYFLVSLAATDFLTGLVALPLQLTVRLVISSATCLESSQFNFFLPAFVFSGSSIYHLSAIAIDRLISVYFPLRYPFIVTPLKAKIAITIIWIYNILFAFTPFLVPGGETDEWICTDVIPKDNSTDDIIRDDNDLAVVLVGIAAFIPFYFLCMLLLYGILVRKAYQHIRQHKHMSSKNGGERDSNVRDGNSRVRGLVTMAMVVGAFGICWLPTSFQFIYEVYFDYTATELIIVQTICEYIAFVNSMVNPIIYAKRNAEFYKGMMNILRLRRRNEIRKTSSRRTSSDDNREVYTLDDLKTSETIVR